jgi:hypothetical protein
MHPNMPLTPWQAMRMDLNPYGIALASIPVQ